MIDPKACDNAVFLRRNANFHEFAPPAGLTIENGGSWTFTVSGLHRNARHCTDGAKSAYLTLADGGHVPVAVSDLLLENAVSEPPPVRLPDGKLDQPYALQPWPAKLELRPGDGFPVVLYPAVGSTGEDVAAIDTVLAMYHRLFPAGHAPFSLAASKQGRAIVFTADAGLKAEAYRLDLSETEIRLSFGGSAGRQYGLTSLAQLLDGARNHPEKFRFPASGNFGCAALQLARLPSRRLPPVLPDGGCGAAD